MAGLLIPADVHEDSSLVTLRGAYLDAVGAFVMAPVDVIDVLDANGHPSGMSVWFTEDGESRALPLNVEVSRLVAPWRVHGVALITRGDVNDPDALDLPASDVEVLRELLALTEPLTAPEV